MRDEIFTAVLDGLLDCLAFLELSDDDTLDPDDAVRQLESIAWRLGRLTKPQQDELAGLIRARAHAWTGTVAEREFLVTTPVALGLIKDNG